MSSIPDDDDRISIDRDLLENDFVNLKIKVPRSMKEMLELLRSRGFHWTISDYIRDAVNRKIEYDVRLLGSVSSAEFLSTLKPDQLEKIKQIIALFSDQNKVWKKELERLERKNKHKKRVHESKTKH